jgi:hypothetical protein
MEFEAGSCDSPFTPPDDELQPNCSAEPVNMRVRWQGQSSSIGHGRCARPRFWIGIRRFRSKHWRARIWQLPCILRANALGTPRPRPRPHLILRRRRRRRHHRHHRPCTRPHSLLPVRKLRHVPLRHVPLRHVPLRRVPLRRVPLRRPRGTGPVAPAGAARRGRGVRRLRRLPGRPQPPPRHHRRCPPPPSPTHPLARPAPDSPGGACGGAGCGVIR